MANYRSFYGSAGSVLVEVEAGGGGGTGGGNLPESLGVIGSIASAYADAVARVPEKKRPSTLEVAFGLRALQDGSFAVGLDPANASFAVRMTWTGEGSASEFVEGLGG